MRYVTFSLSADPTPRLGAAARRPGARPLRQRRPAVAAGAHSGRARRSGSAPRAVAEAIGRRRPPARRRPAARADSAAAQERLLPRPQLRGARQGERGRAQQGDEDPGHPGDLLENADHRERAVRRRPGGSQRHARRWTGRWSSASSSARPARTSARADALAHVFGYTVINDVSARDVQIAARRPVVQGQEPRRLVPDGAVRRHRRRVRRPAGQAAACAASTASPSRTRRRPT